jgi:hypothetical protein
MIRRVLLMIATLALTATTAWAQGGDVSGTVAYVDAATRTIHLTDGRALRLGPGALVTVDGREFPIEALRPGAKITLGPSTQTPTTQAAPVTPAPGHPPIDVSGTIAQIDRQDGVITLQDGRMVKLTGQTHIWQPSRMDSLYPGAQVFVSNAQPVVPTTGQPTGDARLGTVLRVDPANALVVLDDGTLVRIAPSTRMHMAGKNLTLADLRRGDEIVIQSQPRVSSGAGVSALPRDVVAGTVTIDASEIQVMRRVQSP